MNPIRRAGLGGAGVASSLLVEIICRSRTNARMISIFTRIARGLFSTLESIATPCSVNAKGEYLRPPQLEVTICDLKSATSWLVS